LPALAAPSPNAPETSLPHTPEQLRQEPHYPAFVRAQAGDASARDELLVAYAPLVKFALKRVAVHLPAAMDHDDLLSVGTVGLIHALDRYDPDQGVRFETYAIPRVRGAMLDAVRSFSPASRGAIRRGHQLEEAATGLFQALGRTPTRVELAEVMGLTTADVSRFQSEASQVVVSLDSSMDAGRDEGGLSLSDTVMDIHADDPESAAAVTEGIAELRFALEEDLSERQRLVLSLYYEQELTLKEIASVLEVSESRVSQIHTQSLRQLRQRLAMAA
jgi:RNA polymerase sigma factor for flagellar operon FliA